MAAQDFVTAPRSVVRERHVYWIAVFVLIVTASLTVWLCRGMSEGMEMPGGWTMSMMWMPMAGQPWLASAGMFLGMWVAMMVAMMLPSSLPMLLVYRRAALFRGDRRADIATAAVALGYFAVWLAVGVVAFAGGMSLGWAAMRWDVVSRAVPAATGAALIACGIYQLTPWKSACLRHCRDPLSLVASHLHGGATGAFRLGAHHGTFCAACCWGLMLAQLVLGVMNLAVMAPVAAVIALEKLAPRSEWIVRIIGVAAIVGGAVVVVRSFMTA